MLLDSYSCEIRQLHGKEALACYKFLLHHAQRRPTISLPSAANMTNQNPECAICLDRLRDCVLAPCHHLILCSACAHLLYSRHDFCPVCRQQIQDVIRVYHSWFFFFISSKSHCCVCDNRNSQYLFLFDFVKKSTFFIGLSFYASGHHWKISIPFRFSGLLSCALFHRELPRLHPFVNIRWFICIFEYL